MIPWKSVAAIVLVYGLALALMFSFVIIDLWAKAYDEPIVVRVAAIGIMSVLTGGFCLLLFLINRSVFSQGLIWWRWVLALLLLMLELIFIVHGLDIVDWLPVYLSAFVLPVCLRAKSRDVGRKPGRVLAFVITGRPPICDDREPNPFSPLGSIYHDVKRWRLGMRL